MRELCHTVPLYQALHLYGKALGEIAGEYPLDDKIRLVSAALDPENLGEVEDFNGETAKKIGIMFRPGYRVYITIGAGERAEVLRQIFDQIPDDEFIGGMLANLYRPEDFKADERSFGGIREYYGKDFSTILIVATRGLNVQKRKQVIRAATAQIADVERRTDMLRSISAQIHESERAEIDFVGSISFQPVPPSCGNLVLSPGNECMVSVNESIGISFIDVKHLHAVLTAVMPGKDACIVVPNRHMPSWIINTFDSASRGYRSACGEIAEDFLEDLTRYCDYIGFTTFLGVRTPSGEIKPATGMHIWDVEVNNPADAAMFRETYRQPEDLRKLFGRFYDQMKNRSVLVTLVDEGNVVSDPFAAATIAHEVGHLKFAAMIKASGLPTHIFSEEAHEFFAYAYMANFVLGRETRLLRCDPDPAAIELYGRILERVLLHSKQMSAAERNLLQITPRETPVSKTARFIDINIKS